MHSLNTFSSFFYSLDRDSLLLEGNIHYMLQATIFFLICFSIISDCAAFVIVDLKMAAFKPEFAGKLNFYLNVVNDKLKHATDQPCIGILLCKTPNKVVVEYSLKNINSPLGVSEYTTD